MDERIALWIAKAWTIAGTMLDNDVDWEFYLRKARQKHQLDNKYTWERFAARCERRRRARRLRLVGYAASVAVAVTVAGLAVSERFGDESAVCAAFAPGSPKAFLITGSGEQILLCDNFNGTVVDGTVVQTSPFGELTYESPELETHAAQYHTIRIPQGGEYRLVLSDGTRVFLNSESELRYPVAFPAGERRVTLLGEAYFEVAPDPSRPFYVVGSDVQVRATGTAFSVSDYSDDADMRVILVEGGVCIEQGNRILTRLKPNEMFSRDRASGTFEVRKTVPQAATAWKDGYFFFEDEELSSIIRKLHRWYDVKITTGPEVENYRFSGKTRKYESAVNILDMLRLTREITYTISNGNEITIGAAE